MKVLVAVYKDNDPTVFNSLRLSVEEEAYIEDLIDDIDCFLEEQLIEIQESEDE